MTTTTVEILINIMLLIVLGGYGFLILEIISLKLTNEFLFYNIKKLFKKMKNTIIKISLYVKLRILYFLYKNNFNSSILRIPKKIKVNDICEIRLEARDYHNFNHRTFRKAQVINVVSVLAICQEVDNFKGAHMGLSSFTCNSIQAPYKIIDNNKGFEYGINNITVINHRFKIISTSNSEENYNRYKIGNTLDIVYPFAIYKEGTFLTTHVSNLKKL